MNNNKLKGALSPFLVSLSKAKTHIYISETPKIGVQFCLKLDFKCSKSKHMCYGLQKARMEMDCIWKK